MSDPDCIFCKIVIPRYEDDPLRLPWTPAEGDSEEIAAVASALT